MAEELQSPAIIKQVARSTALRARDVRTNITELGFERGIELSVTTLADENVGLRQTCAELVTLVDKLIDRIAEMGQINEAVVKQVDVLRSRDEKYEASKEG